MVGVKSGEEKNTAKKITNIFGFGFRDFVVRVKSGEKENKTCDCTCFSPRVWGLEFSGGAPTHPKTLNRETPNPKPQTPNPKPQTLNRQAGTTSVARA